ncbi:MAG: 5' nucleotidase, NT5C type [Promethearchaeota archaeon]
MKIAIDIDGVLLDIIVTYCEIYNKRYKPKKPKRKNDVVKWDFFADWNMDEETGFKIFYEIYEDSGNIPFIGEGAPKIMKKLNESYDLDIVSARVPEYRSSITDKLNSHEIVAGIQYTELILLHHRPYDIKLKQNYDLYVDDNPNLVEPIKTMKNRTLLLFDQPWNQNSVCEENVHRVHNWEEVEKKIFDL